MDFSSHHFDMWLFSCAVCIVNCACGKVMGCVASFQASGVEVASFWPKLFVGAMAAEDMNKLICSLPSGGGGGGDAAPAAAVVAAPAAAGAKKEEKKKAAPPPEEEEDMGFSLFD